MVELTTWSAGDLQAIASADEFHIAPRRANGKTGTPTWIWSVAVDTTLYVRPYHGTKSSWYQSALQIGTGVVESGGTNYQVRFTPVDDEALMARVDEAYRSKYAGSTYLPPMLAPGPRTTTVAITPTS
ncbi:DUF2255 family protein [Micromonospora sp. NPDC005171]|uniref:DUF2255 family protein n=1 Tax=Micromonospora sp. NPDC005171 TaxID=3156866 RepID=UPI0033A4C34E